MQYIACVILSVIWCIFTPDGLDIPSISQHIPAYQQGVLSPMAYDVVDLNISCIVLLLIIYSMRLIWMLCIICFQDKLKHHSYWKILGVKWFGVLGIILIISIIVTLPNYDYYHHQLYYLDNVGQLYPIGLYGFLLTLLYSSVICIMFGIIWIYWFIRAMIFIIHKIFLKISA